MDWLNWALERSGGTPWGNGRPNKLHIQLTENDLKPGRTIIVGDIHGCYDELQDLLRKCEYCQKEDNLIFAGDLINKGPDSVKVLDEARRLGALCIRGNHEDGIQALLKARKLISKMSSSYAWLTSVSEQNKEFLKDLPFTIRLTGYRVGVVHAGMIPGVPFEEQTLESMLFLEDLELNDTPEDGRRFKRSYSVKSASCDSWAAYWEGPCHMFFGHAADRGLQKHPFATGLDTGCVQGGQLTAAILPPCSQLRRSDSFTSIINARAPTLQELNATILSVPARKQYKQPKSPRGLQPVRSGNLNSKPPPIKSEALQLVGRASSAPVALKL